MFPVYSELLKSSGGRGCEGRGGGGRMALALVVLAVCGAGAAGSRDEDYGGLGMPLYEYEGAQREGRRGGAGDDAEYPERDGHSLDYQYEDDQPRGRGMNGRTYYAKPRKASEMRPSRRPNNKSKKTSIIRDQDFETLDKYNNDETTENIKPDRRNYNSKSVNKDRDKERRSGGHELRTLRTPTKFSRQRAEDPREHPDSQDLDDPETPHHSVDENYSAGRMTTRRKKRRKQRDKPQTSTEDLDEVEDNSEHGRRPMRRDLRRREERWWIKEPTKDEEEGETTLSAVTRSKSRKNKRKNEEPDYLENDDIKLDEDRLRRGPVPEAGAVMDGGSPGLSPAATRAGPPVPQEHAPADYDDYPMDVETLARRRAMLERVLGGYSTAETTGDTDTPLLSPPTPTNTAAFSTAVAENAVVTTVTAPTTLTTTTEPAPTTVIDTTLALVSQVPEEPRELSIAEKSRLSILKKSQKKDSLKGSMMTKPPVLRHFTSSGGGGRRAGAEVVPGDRGGSTERFELLSPFDERDTSERLARVKRIMRERLVSRARSLRDLTDGWNDVVCEYVDDMLLRADAVPYPSAAPPARTLAPLAFVGCAVLLVSAV